MYMRGSKFHGPVSLRGWVSGSQLLSRDRECGTEAADNLTPASGPGLSPAFVQSPRGVPAPAPSGCGHQMGWRS